MNPPCREASPLTPPLPSNALPAPPHAKAPTPCPPMTGGALRHTPLQPEEPWPAHPCHTDWPPQHQAELLALDPSTRPSRRPSQVPGWPQCPAKPPAPPPKCCTSLSARLSCRLPQAPGRAAGPSAVSGHLWARADMGRATAWVRGGLACPGL